MKVSVTLTSCGRIDLLEKTLLSFHCSNRYPIDEFIIINDSPQHKDELNRKFGGYKFIHNPNNIGLSKSLDVLFNAVQNEYFFHLEDDWWFDTPSNFIGNSIKILESNKDIHQVWVRHESDNPHKTIGEDICLDDFKYRVVDPNFMDVWTGYSWNPGLRRKSDYLRMFPNGVSAFADERECSAHSKNFNYKTVLLLPTVCNHIGWGRTTHPHLSNR